MARTLEQQILEPLYVSIHIPKTGGTTFTSILQKKFPDTLQLTYRQQKAPDPEAIQCLHGHKIIPEYNDVLASVSDIKWITFLRDPLATAISLYHYIQTRPEAQFEDKGLEAYLTHDGPHKWPKPPGYGHNRMLKKLRLKKGVDIEAGFVGITERFDESIFLMFKHFGWEFVSYKIKNRGKYEPPRLSEEITERFRMLNARDYSYYEKMNTHLDSLIDQYGSSWDQDLAEFKEKFVKTDKSSKKKSN